MGRQFNNANTAHICMALLNAAKVQLRAQNVYMRPIEASWCGLAVHVQLELEDEVTHDAQEDEEAKENEDVHPVNLKGYTTLHCTLMQGPH